MRARCAASARRRSAWIGSAASAKLFRADLRRADLSAADLSGAKLSEGRLFGAELSGAVWIDGRRCAPGSVGACRFAQAAMIDDAAPKPDKRGSDRKRSAEISN